MYDLLVTNHTIQKREASREKPNLCASDPDANLEGEQAMPPIKPEELQQRTEKIGKWTVQLTSYKAGDVYRCEIDNIDPGAKIARGSGPNRNIAEQAALEKATATLPT